MKTWSKRKKWLIGGLVVLVAGLLALRLWPKEKAKLSSLPFVSAEPWLENKQGHFKVTNKGTNSIGLWAIGVEAFVEGSWQTKLIRQREYRYYQEVRPSEQVTLHFPPPEGTNKWRGMIQVDVPRQGLLPRMKAIFTGLRHGFPSRSGIYGASASDVLEVVTREIEP